MAIVRAGKLPIVTLAVCGHRKHDNLSIVAIPVQAVNLPGVPVAVSAGNLPVLALVVRGHHKRGSLPVIAIVVRGHRERGNLPVLTDTAPTTRPMLPSPRAPLICPSTHLPFAPAMLSCHQLTAALLLSLPAAEFFFG
jgi:hypothetical protein